MRGLVGRMAFFHDRSEEDFFFFLPFGIERERRCWPLTTTHFNGCDIQCSRASCCNNERSKEVPYGSCFYDISDRSVDRRVPSEGRLFWRTAAKFKSIGSHGTCPPRSPTWKACYAWKNLSPRHCLVLARTYTLKLISQERCTFNAKPQRMTLSLDPLSRPARGLGYQPIDTPEDEMYHLSNGSRRTAKTW
ncbi:hypothetical protein AVEN_78575-1 [Araneus ventricosus]|uniref:Uncharacterized protein n=1 Tax=Araneus ventricosus TaxID=182803 RepID=A0A4Y2LAT4_ARAVE|nr:hypothetical protein AVEN_78575-1 [Araneus ventricosus]